MKELGSEKVCIALGYFDSVHMGHRKLIETASDIARRLGVECAVATFCNNAYKLFNIQDKQVYTYTERCMLLDELCDLILPMRFDTRLKNHTAEEFLQQLFARYDIAAVVCGYDYSFGKGAKGDAEFLRAYCAEHGVLCEVVPKFESNGERVSTTEVKACLSAGDIERANVMLGSPFMLCGRVVRGRGAGRMFDIPTANVKFSSSKMLPKAGVYGTSCVIDGKTYYGATNVGARPTFGLTKTVVEMMIDGFNDNIYDKEIKIVFHKYLRGCVKFDTPAQLSAQVRKDIRWYQND